MSEDDKKPTTFTNVIYRGNLSGLFASTTFTNLAAEEQIKIILWADESMTKAIAQYQPRKLGFWERLFKR